jgi:DMSO reductase anchor subunit
MHNWSLVCFTLFTQSAIGLVWVSVMGRWFGGGTRVSFSIWPMSIALTLTGFGLYAALAHLAKPRLAPHALRNLTASWLSREVLLVQAFAGAVALLILISLLDASSGLVILEATACLLGGAALFAMTRVYLLKTVPVWNSPAPSWSLQATPCFWGALWVQCSRPSGIRINPAGARLLLRPELAFCWALF